ATAPHRVAPRPGVGRPGGTHRGAVPQGDAGLRRWPDPLTEAYGWGTTHGDPRAAAHPSRQSGTTRGRGLWRGGRDGGTEGHGRGSILSRPRAGARPSASALPTMTG